MRLFSGKGALRFISEEDKPMLLWAIAAVIAFFIKGLCGFANTMVFTSILSFSTNNIDISPIDLLLSYFTNTTIAIREKRRIQWNVVLPLAGLMLIGCVPGLLFLKNVEARLVKITFGGVIVFLGVKMLLKEILSLPSKPYSRPLIGFIGLLSGALNGMFGIGALSSAYLAHESTDTAAFKANICTTFLAVDTVRLVLYAATGIITPESLKRTLFVLPFMALGLFLGLKSSAILNEKTAKKIVIVMLMISGAALILTNL